MGYFVEEGGLHSVASGAIDDGRIGYVLAVVDEYGPDVHEDEEEDVCELLEREDEREDVVRDGLSEAVERVECVRGVGRRHDPFMVWFVQTPVDAWVVETAVDEVDAEVCKQYKKWKLDPVVCAAEDRE